MKRVLTSLHQHLLKMRVAYLVLAVSLVPAGVVYYRVRENVQTHDLARFDRVIKEQEAAIEQRIPRCLDEMLAVRGLFAANSSVNGDQWQKYVASLGLQQQFPGILMMGYLERGDGEKKSGFLKRSSTSAGSQANAQVEADRSGSFPALYLKEFGASELPEIGHNHFADPERHPAMELARDSGQPVATGKLAQTNVDHAGFIIYLPVYRSGTGASTVTERRAALQGFIFASLDADKLLSSTFGKQHNPIVDCEVFDGTELVREHLLHDDDQILHSAEKKTHQLTRTIALPVLNRTWTLYFSSLPAFFAESQSNLPIIALICWLTLGFLLFAITWAEVKARARSERITAELQKSETALEAEKERLAVTLYSIGDGVITTDTDGRVLSLNKVAEEMTGWAQTEALGKPVAGFFHVIQEQTRETRENPVETVLETGLPLSSGGLGILMARDGRERMIADSASPIRNHDGCVIGVVVVFRDITEKQKSEAELLKESKLESVGLLAGGIAHDFNNILQGILGNLSLARMNAHSTEKMLERLAGVEKSAMRAKDLTQQLVMFARGGAPIRKQLHLSNTVKDAALFALHGSNVHCEFSLPGDIWPVEVDEGQFRQVINNIVLNAVQSMAEGGKMAVRSENVEFTGVVVPPLIAGKYVKISIKDHGTGIHPEHLPRIFDPYFTTRKHARGLGLASAYSVIRKHDGQINVDTAVGRGSTFQIYLPASLKIVETVNPDAEQRKFFGQGRVLVMDDEVDILTLVREILQIMGYDVEVAKDGAEALERYMTAKKAGNPFSVVVMDLTVPEGMGGKEAIRRLKELDPEVKAIVSSGYSYDPVMANFQEFGFSGVIPKPYVMEELGRVINEVIRKRSAADAVVLG
ncbi:MAG: multi-sensor hybrid histidine kinase [Pedosphaera sp.]|nr:multi-sensor hybrid histidine kinase [Pedosphaera sp.]